MKAGSGGVRRGDRRRPRPAALDLAHITVDAPKVSDGAGPGRRAWPMVCKAYSARLGTSLDNFAALAGRDTPAGLLGAARQRHRTSRRRRAVRPPAHSTQFDTNL